MKVRDIIRLLEQDGCTKLYAVVFETAPSSNWSAYVPDLPGCVSTGKTLEETELNIRDAIAFHLEGMTEDGLPIPEARSYACMIEVA